MPSTSVSVQSPNAAGADGLMQADGFYSPITPGVPVGSNGVHSHGAAAFPYGIGNVAGGFLAGGQGAVVAAFGTVQGNATALNTVIADVAATASTEGVILTGGVQFVGVPGSIGVKVYPPTNGKIGTHATNIAVVVAAAHMGIFTQITSTLWVAASAPTL